MITRNRIKKRNLYKIFQRKMKKCIKRVIQATNKLEDAKEALNQLTRDGVFEIKHISLKRNNKNGDKEKKKNILLIRQKKEIKGTSTIWIIFDKKLEFEELWYQQDPLIKQEGYVFLIATKPTTKNQFVSKILLGRSSRLTLYTINEFAPAVGLYKTSLEISLQRGATLNYSAFTLHAPRVFDSVMRVHGSEDTVINYNAHFCNTNYYTTHHQWILSKNSRINISLSGIVGTQSIVELNDEFICTHSNGEINFKTDILKISPLAHIRVRPTISIGSTASYSENINIVHFKKEYFYYLSRLGFGKEEILDLLVYSYLEAGKFLRSSDLCSRFLIL